MKIKFTFLLICINLMLQAQVKFTVFKTIGNVEFFSSKTNQWEKLKSKDSITNDTKIKCLPQSSLILFDSKYRIYEVKKEGESLVKNSVNPNNPSTNKEMQKAVKFFVEQTFSAASNGNTQKSKGAVYRGEESIFPWDSTFILEDTFDLNINLSKDNYPVKVSLNGYSVMVYEDTTLRIPSSYLNDGVYNTVKIGNRRVIHLFKEKEKKKLLLGYINSLTKPGSKFNAINYSLVISNCIEMGYMDTARRLIMQISSDRANFEMVKELLKDNAVARAMMVL